MIVELTDKEVEYLNSLLHCELMFKPNNTKFDDYKQVLKSIKTKLNLKV